MDTNAKMNYPESVDEVLVYGEQWLAATPDEGVNEVEGFECDCQDCT
jgi:hypothetical protein